MKRLILLIMLCLSLGLLAGCQKTEDISDTKIYYISSDKNRVVPVAHDYAASDTEGMIEEALIMLDKDVTEVEYTRTMPASVKVEEYELDNGILSLYLSREYQDIDSLTEILIRAAIVRTLVQIDGVDSVVFYVGKAPLSYANGAVVGIMTAETFIDDFGQETESLRSTTLKLYVASADGMSLVEEERDVYYSSNVTLEKLVIDQLLKGPESTEYLSTIPSEAKLISVQVTDGICYVNFDSAFEATISGVTENVTIYSIVNSLMELSNISGVQLLVGGETPHLSNTDVDLSLPLVANYDIINVQTGDEDDDTEYIDDEEYVEEDTQE